MDRRMFLGILAGGLLAAPRSVEAQEAGKVFRVGLLADFSPRDVPWIVGFEQRLGELDYVEDKNLVIEFRSARGRPDRLQSLATELVRLAPDVIAYFGGPDGAQALKQATGTIPILFSAIEWDPVASGIVTSLARPGRNLTGISSLATEFAAKRLQLLLEVIPQVDSLAMDAPPQGLEGGFRKAVTEHARAVQVLGSPAFFPERKRLAELGIRYRLPTSFQRPSYAEAGLMSYGPDIDSIDRHLADYADRVLKGAKPAELPVEQPTKFELVINLKTAKTLGLAIPSSLLQRADQVIE